MTTVHLGREPDSTSAGGCGADGPCVGQRPVQRCPGRGPEMTRVGIPSERDVSIMARVRATDAAFHPDFVVVVEPSRALVPGDHNYKARRRGSLRVRA